MASESQDIETATVQLSPVMESTPLPGQPDNKTRRYDRQLRLWASSGQNALESSHILVLSASPTSNSILKNLVLPGIGAFTILDPDVAEGTDIGANFFLDPDSIGKNKAEESVKFLGELNDSVQGNAETQSLDALLAENPEYLHSYSLIFAHNLTDATLERISSLLWEPSSKAIVPPPLIVVRSAGFLADFAIQFKEHPIVTSHSESSPSLRIDKPFPALLAYAFSIDFAHMDVTDHGHVPYVVILVKALQEWKNDHAGSPPKTYAEKQEFKARIAKMKRKDDEENFDEAVAQAYRAWTSTTVPRDIEVLFRDPSTKNITAESDPFFHLVNALEIFAAQPPHALPLSATLPDMKADTSQYIHLQNLYKIQAVDEKAKFVEILRRVGAGFGDAGLKVIEAAVGLSDEFVKNAHGLKLLRGKKWGTEDLAELASAIGSAPAAVATHLSLSALFAFQAKNGRFPAPGSAEDSEEMTAWVRTKVNSTGWKEDEDHPMADEAEDEEDETPKPLTFWDHVENAVGEVCRAPTSELPTVAALLGGMVAQEAIKIITKQYVPIDGVCVIDLVASTTAVIKV